LLSQCHIEGHYVKTVFAAVTNNRTEKAVLGKQVVLWAEVLTMKHCVISVKDEGLKTFDTNIYCDYN